MTVLAELANVGAGHYLPTTPTPAAWLQHRAARRPRLPRSRARAPRLRIGRDVCVRRGRWHERSDTRIPPGEPRSSSRAHGPAAGRPRPRTARVTVEVHPDDYYEGFYVARSPARVTPAMRALYERALARARSTHYVAEQRDVALPAR